MVVIRQARIPETDDRASMQHVNAGFTLANKPQNDSSQFFSFCHVEATLPDT
jgi:hypothetical protein